MIQSQQIRSSGKIYDDLRTRLVTSEFNPTDKMKSETLGKVYNCAASTMREILFRLYYDGFVEFEEQKGFRVPELNLQTMRELMHMRILIEREGARLSIEKGDLEWESGVIAAHHKLAHIEKTFMNTDDLKPYIMIWNDAERQFHESLVCGCGSALLLETHKNIYDRFRQHLTSRKQHYGFRCKNISEHQAIVDAVVRRDADLCGEKIEQHISLALKSSDNCNFAKSA